MSESATTSDSLVSGSKLVEDAASDAASGTIWVRPVLGEHEGKKCVKVQMLIESRENHSPIPRHTEGTEESHGIVTEEAQRSAIEGTLGNTVDGSRNIVDKAITRSTLPEKEAIRKVLSQCLPCFYFIDPTSSDCLEEGTESLRMDIENEGIQPVADGRWAIGVWDAKEPGTRQPDWKDSEQTTLVRRTYGMSLPCLTVDLPLGSFAYSRVIVATQDNGWAGVNLTSHHTNARLKETLRGKTMLTGKTCLTGQEYAELLRGVFQTNFEEAVNQLGNAWTQDEREDVYKVIVSDRNAVLSDYGYPTVTVDYYRDDGAQMRHLSDVYEYLAEPDTDTLSLTNAGHLESAPSVPLLTVS